MTSSAYIAGKNHFWTSAFRLFDLKTNWKLRVNLGDLELSRKYFVGKELIFRPHFGLRGGSLNQLYSATEIGRVSPYSGDDITIITNLKSDSWLIGPRAGLDTSWRLGCGFRMFGDVAASLFYQKFDVKSIQVKLVQSGVTDDSILNLKNDVRYINPNFELGLGFGWGTGFCDDSWHFDLTAGYEFHQFWNQNMMRHLNDTFENLDTTYVDADAGDLMFHGLTITARLDF